MCQRSAEREKQMKESNSVKEWTKTGFYFLCLVYLSQVPTYIFVYTTNLVPSKPKILISHIFVFLYINIRTNLVLFFHIVSLLFWIILIRFIGMFWNMKGLLWWWLTQQRPHFSNLAIPWQWKQEGNNPHMGFRFPFIFSPSFTPSISSIYVFACISWMYNLECELGFYFNMKFFSRRSAISPQIWVSLSTLDVLSLL